MGDLISSMTQKGIKIEKGLPITASHYEKETRGGMRDNSSTMHLQKKEREFRCHWCDKKFKSTQAVVKYCCQAHRSKAFRASNRFKKPKRLSQLRRRGKGFRPPLALIRKNQGSSSTS